MYYSKICASLCQGVLTHPETGVVYGGTDFSTSAKLAELQAVPVTEASAGSGPVLESAVVALDEGGESATLTRTWREQNAAEVAADAKAALADSDALSARKIEDLWALLLAKEVISAADVPAAVATWIDERETLRESL